MRLADFIRRDMDAILSEWEKFAAQLLVGRKMEALALRDHAKQILDTVANDLDQAQSGEQQERKSKGHAPPTTDAAETAAETHAVLRAKSGFDINQMVSEYRALRATVHRLWADARDPAATDLQDSIRFNEAIDQALAESIALFTAQVDHARNLLLGMLGHDMRSPLQAIQVTAAYLARIDAGPEVSTAAGRLVNSGARMKALLDDLLDFNRTRLGLGVNIVASEINLGEVFTDEIQQLRVSHPQRQIDLMCHGDLRGSWDANRLHQVLGNLVLNALKYGSPGTPVGVVLTGLPADVVFAVSNRGAVIEPLMLEQIFDPLRQGPGEQPDSGVDGSLGLGLYICREIAAAHSGDISARSDPAETVFTVRLPRVPGP